MAIKIVYLRFANKKLDIRDYIPELNYAVEHARFNLKYRHNVDIMLEVLGDQVFVLTQTINR